MSSNSERWSKASSDSDGSVLGFGSGECRLDIPRAADVKELLKTYAYLPGGRDRIGFLYIVVHNYGGREDADSDSLRRIIAYLVSTRSIQDRDAGFSFLVDLTSQLKCAPGVMRPLLKHLEDQFPYKVGHVYILPSEGGSKPLMSALSSLKKGLEVKVTSLEGLMKYFDKKDLTSDYGGSLIYSQELWSAMRMAFEKFLFESMALSSKLDEIRYSLQLDDIKQTPEGVRDQLHHHQHVKKWIAKAPVEVLAEEATKVVRIITDSCQCGREEDLKDEYKNSMLQVKNMVEKLVEQREFLKELWLARKKMLELHYQFAVFNQDAEKMIAWITDSRGEFMDSCSEIGEDLETAEELVEEQRQFEANCGDVQVNIDCVLRVASRLRETKSFHEDLITRLSSKLESEWSKLYEAVQKRSALLEASVVFHRSSEQYMRRSKDWLEELHSLEHRSIKTLAECSNALKEHDHLKVTMTEAYELVGVQAQALLATFKTPPANDSREEKARSRMSDYSQAGQHVMHVIVQLYDQNKQLKILWEKQRVRINQKFRLSEFEQDCAEILKWVRGSGHNFLSRYSWVGDQLEVAEELLMDQEEFEKSFQETYGKAKKLLDSALHLAETKECDPQEIKTKANELESEFKGFNAKIKKRRELLKMAVNFYKSSQKLSKWADKLKEDINLDDPTTAESQNFDVALEKHRHECESALESLLATVQEGETLSQELLTEIKTTPGRDNRTSWILTGAQSPEASRLAVELYLRELNQSRVQLERLWLGRKQKLDNWVKVKNFERDANSLGGDSDAWVETWQKKELPFDVSRANTIADKFNLEHSEISERFQHTLAVGRELEAALRESGTEVAITRPDGTKLDGLQHISDIVRRLQACHDIARSTHNRLRTKFDFCLRARKLDADAKKVSGWIRHGDTILQASHDAGSSMFEAEALLREYERFHTAIETTRLGVMDVRESADRLIRDGHYDPIIVEGVAAAVETKWKQLMQRAENRRAVVFASYNFYRSAEQVGKLLEKFGKECKSEEDPCAKFSDYELNFKREKIEALIKKTDQERKAVEDGCQKVKDCSDEFLKCILPKGDGTSTPVIDGSVGRLEIVVGDLVEQVTSQEAFVVKQLQLRRNVLNGCLDYVRFEESAQEALAWIQEHGSSVSDEFGDQKREKLVQKEAPKTPDGANTASLELARQSEYKSIFEEIREKVKHLLQEAGQVITRTHFHSENVKTWALAIDNRYKDLACHMKQYRESMEIKLGCSIPGPEEEEEGEWPNLLALQVKPADLAAVSRRDVSNDSGIHVMTEEKRRSVKRLEFVINELIQTEKAYVNDLKCCIENFLYPMLDSPDVPASLDGKHDVIFGNIEEIYEFHSTVFLQELQKYETRAEEVGNGFVAWAEKFQMYVEYCANKPYSNTFLIEHGENFFDDLQIKRGLGLSLAAYVIKPVQRITKYQLLLKELLSCCDDNDGSLQAGLEVMLSVPRQANDAMYLCLIEGFDEGSLETLGKILLQDSFSVWDARHIRKRGKDRHVFLFEQALLFSKEIKDVNGKTRFAYKSKLKTSELGITEHIAEDPCKFAVWTGEPPFTEEKRVIKAESVEIKQMWVKELRELIQQFQFGILRPRASFYPTSPRKKNAHKVSSNADVSVGSAESASVVNGDRISQEFDAATICSKASFDNQTSDVYVACEDYVAKGANEISVEKGQSVEVLSRPPGSRSWRIRIVNDVTDSKEGLVPFGVLRRVEESPMKGKRSSVETLNSQSSEDSFQDGPCSPQSDKNTASRRRTKSVNLGTLKMRTWARSSGKKLSTSASPVGKPPLPITPTRSTSTSGGGSKKLQHLLGAPERDIDLLLRPADFRSMTLGRTQTRHTAIDRVKFKSLNLDAEDAGFQEGENMSEVDSGSDTNESSVGGSAGAAALIEDVEAVALRKRVFVLKELLLTEQDYVADLHVIVDQFLPVISERSNTPEELRGKEQVIFGNAPELLAFHKDSFVKELEKCETAPEKLASVFVKAERRFELYVHYCQNKPKSSALIHDYLDTYFEEVSRDLGLRLRLSDYLIKPAQRITKYQLLLKDFAKYTARAGLSTAELDKALQVMQMVPKRANDMMHVGMLEGFSGSLNALGQLLMQETLYVASIKTQTRPVERRVFLFEQILVFSEPFERKSDLTVYIYRHSLKMNCVGLTEQFDDDPCKWAVWSKRTSGTNDIFIMIARSPATKNAWVAAVRQILESQFHMAKVLEQPIQYKSVENGVSADAQRVDSSLPSSPRQDTEQNGAVSSSGDSSSATTGKIAVASQVLGGKPASTLKHVKLISLDDAKSQEDLTKPFPVQERFTVTENYQAQTPDELTVFKNDVVYLVSRPKKSSQFIQVKSFARERAGLVPPHILKKVQPDEKKERDDVAESDDAKVRRSASFGHTDKPKRERAKRTKSVNSSTLLRAASLRRKKDGSKKKDRHATLSSPSKSVLDKLHQHWTSSLEASEDELGLGNSDAAESLNKILSRDTKTSFEVAPEFKILPRDVAVEAPANVKLTCTLVANPDPQITWTMNDTVEIQPSDKYSLVYRNHVCVLEIMRTHPADSGTYTVTATNSLGSASCSAKVTVRGLAKPGVPGKPVVISSTPTSATLQWEPPASASVIPVHTYSVHCKDSSSGLWQVVVPVCATTSWVVEGLSSGKWYQFRVVASNEVGAGEESVPSDPVEVGVRSATHGAPLEIKWKEHIEEAYNIYGDLGRGRFSIVKKCVHKASGREYAAKIVKRRALAKEDVESEIAVLQSLNHPSVVGIVEIYDAPKGLVIIEQLLSGGRLFDHIVVMDHLTEANAIQYTKQLLEGLQYIHGCNIAHLDIKPENLLLSGGDEARVVLADFGDAVRLRSAPYHFTFVGNPEFSAPEVVSSEPVSFATDMWSVGVIVYVLLSGVSPFYSDNHERACENVTEIRYRFPEDFFVDISDEAKDFIEELLIRDQSHRPDACECLQFPWIRMSDPQHRPRASQKRIALSRLAALNARRRYQYELSNGQISSSVMSPGGSRLGKKL